MKQQRSLTERIIWYAVLLALLASVITASLGIWISDYFVSERSQQVNQLVLDAIVSNTNETFVDIEKAINAALSMPEMDALFATETDDYYTKTVLKLQIEKNLSDILLYKDFIDGIYISANNQQIKLSNTSLLDFYEFESGPALSDINAMLIREERRGFYLYDYQQSYTDFFCIAYPVWGETESQLDAIIVIMLSKSFVEQLGIQSAAIILSDGIHASSSLSDVEPSSLHKANLNWDNWSVTYYSSDQNLRNSQWELIQYSIGLSLLLILLAWPVSYIFTQYYLMPIRSLSQQIYTIKKHKSHQRINLRSQGSMRTKLFTLFSMIVMAVLLCNIGLIYIQTQYMIDNEVGSELETNTELIEKQAELIFSRNYDLMRSIVVDDVVQAYLHDISAAEEQTLEQTMKRFLVENSAILNVAFYDVEGKLLYTTSYREALLSESNAGDDVSYLINNAAANINRVIEQNLFNNVSSRLGMRIISLTPNQNGGNLLGCILLDMDMDKLANSFSQHNAYPNAEVYLVDQTGADLLVRMQQPDSPDAANIDFIEGASRQTINKQGYYIMCRKIELTDWHLVVTIPWQDYTVQKNLFLFLLLGIFIVLLPSIWGIAFLLSGMLLRDVRHLIDTCKQISAGDLSRRIKRISNTREIGVLAKSFNEMLDNLRTATDEKLSSELQAKDAIIHARELELHLLQAQIKPHFLYNTLRTIQFMASQKDPAAVKMLDLLITLFRVGINRDDEIVTVEEELKYIEAYVEIQRIRFPDQIHMIYEVPDEMKKLPMLKLLLQPIVENAIGHGIRERGISGEIRIVGEVAGDNVCFEVQDNGTGMDPDKLAELNYALSSASQKQSIGLFNVNERVKLRYGEQYGLTLYNNDQQGLTVRLVLPRYVGNATV